jgi:hypothetical protein
MTGGSRGGSVVAEHLNSSSLLISTLLDSLHRTLLTLCPRSADCRSSLDVISSPHDAVSVTLMHRGL